MACTRVKGLLAFAVAQLVWSASLAGPIVVDGRLDDWGITVGDFADTSCFDGRSPSRDPTLPTPCTGSRYAGLQTPGTAAGVLGWVLDDTNDVSNEYFLGPRQGGQNYDGEFLGVALQGSTLYVAILTGQRPDNGQGTFAPGDLVIDVDGRHGAFGVEIGGGWGGGRGKPLTVGSAGATYLVNADGNTVAFQREASRRAGSIWTDVVWERNAAGLKVDADYLPTQILGGRKVGDASAYIYTRNSFTTQHAVIELSLDLALLGDGRITGLSWQPACANDTLVLEERIPPDAIPEPGPLALLAAGILALAASQHLRRCPRRRGP